MEMVTGRHSRNSKLGVFDSIESAPLSPSSRSHEIESYGEAAPLSNVAKRSNKEASHLSTDSASTAQHSSCTVARTARDAMARFTSVLATPGEPLHRLLFFFASSVGCLTGPATIATYGKVIEKGFCLASSQVESKQGRGRPGQVRTHESNNEQSINLSVSRRKLSKTMARVKLHQNFAEIGNRAQVRPNLTELEERHLEIAKSDRFLQDDRRSGLEVWPKFFRNPDEAGKELKDGLVTIWSTFIIVETLLISIAMQPFITNIPNLGGWQFEVYGLLWMLVLVGDFLSLVVTALMLGYLHAYPGKLTYIWMCKIGSWAVLPSFLVLLCAILALVAIGFSSWIIYGTKVGATCVAAAVSVILYACVTATFLSKASISVQEIE